MVAGPERAMAPGPGDSGDSAVICRRSPKLDRAAGFDHRELTGRSRLITTKPQRRRDHRGSFQKILCDLCASAATYVI
jgi:hypothetical protein